MPKIKDQESGKFVSLGDQPMADKALSVRVPVDVDAAVRALGDRRSEWLRRVIINAARAELMGDAPAVEQTPSPAPKRKRGPRTAGKAIALRDN